MPRRYKRGAPHSTHDNRARYTAPIAIDHTAGPLRVPDKRHSINNCDTARLVSRRGINNCNAVRLVSQRGINNRDAARHVATNARKPAGALAGGRATRGSHLRQRPYQERDKKSRHRAPWAVPAPYQPPTWAASSSDFATKSEDEAAQVGGW